MNQQAITNSWVGRNRGTLLIGGPAVLLIVCLVFYLMGGRYISTDDAYIEAARVQVSSNISGTVAHMEVKDNQKVHAGDALFTLDDRPFAIAVEDAKAKLANAKLQVQALKATLRQHRADEQAATDQLAYAQREYNRQKTLAASGIASRAQLDQANNALDQAKSKMSAAGEQSATALANLGGNADIPVDEHPNVQQAQAELDRAELNLSYTTVKAPIDGIVTKVEQLQVGDYITAASPLFALVSDSDVWVEANFKEDDLAHMHPGQNVTFSIDTYAGKNFAGKVASLSPGTGSTFSLLPPENASGNWVKVVQRLPVRLSIDRKENDPPLAAGMSVTAEVDTQHHHSLLFWRND